MSGFNQGIIVGRVYNSESFETIAGSIVALGKVLKKGWETLTLYTTTGQEVKSHVFPNAYSDDNGFYAVVFQWDASDIGEVMDSANMDKLGFSIMVSRRMGEMLVPSKTKGTLKLRLHGSKLVGAGGLPTDTAGWAKKYAEGIYKAVEKIKISVPPLGKGKTTELYYLVEVLDLIAYPKPYWGEETE